MPAANTVHIDRLATMVAEAHKNSLTEYVADVVCPGFKVQHKSDKFAKWPLATFFRRPTKRAAGLKRAPTTPFVRRDYKVTSGDYSTEQFGVEHALDDTTKGNADAAYRVEQIPIELLAEDILREKEIRVAALVTNTATVTRNATLLGADRWEDADSPIIDQWETAFDSVKTRGGRLANLVVIPREAWRYVKHHPEMLARVSSKDRYAPAVNIEMLKDIFVGSIDPNCQFVIASALYDSGAETELEADSGVTLSPIWGKDVVFCWRDPSPQLGKPTFCHAPEFMPFAMGRYREEGVTSDIFRALEDRNEVLVEADMGYVLKTVIT